MSEVKCYDAIIEEFLSTLSPFMENVKDMYLFGSRCRNDWRPDSDYDILIVVERRDKKIIDKFYDAVMDVLLDTGRLISLKIFTVTEFSRLKSIPTPFIHNVINEGIKLEKRV